MSTCADSRVLLLAAATLHLGFQAPITVLVYPALSRLPADRWTSEHDLHCRRIVPVVAVVYAALLAGSVAAAVIAPDPAVVVTLLAALATFAVTAFSAAPTHGRLGAGHDPVLIAHLLRADRWRTAGALVCVLAALVAVLTT